LSETTAKNAKKWNEVRLHYLAIDHKNKKFLLLTTPALTFFDPSKNPRFSNETRKFVQRVEGVLFFLPPKSTGGFAYDHGGAGLHSGWRLLAAQAQIKTHRSERCNNRSARKLKAHSASRTACPVEDCVAGGVQRQFKPKKRTGL